MTSKEPLRPLARGGPDTEPSHITYGPGSPVAPDCFVLDGMGTPAIQPERDLFFAKHDQGPLHSGWLHAVWKAVRSSPLLFPHLLPLAPAPANEPGYIFTDFVVCG